MPPVSNDNKNSLQSVVDNIQTQAIKTQGPAQGYVPNPNLKSLRTLQGDMQEHIETKHETVASIAIAEQKKKIEQHEPTFTDRGERKSHGILFVIIGLVCLIVGGVICGALYFLKSETQTEEMKVSLEKTLIPYTEKKNIILPSLQTDSLAFALTEEQTNLKAPVNSVLYPVFSYNTQPLTDTQIIDLLAPRAPDALKRNISAIMPGVMSYDTNELFFVLHTDDFGTAYARMLDWESTIGQDMSPFFPELKKQVSQYGSVFYDETYKNKDVRVIRNEAGSVIFLYGFLDKENLVITSNEKIFEALLAKYNQSKLSR